MPKVLQMVATAFLTIFAQPEVDTSRDQLEWLNQEVKWRTDVVVCTPKPCVRGHEKVLADGQV